MSTNTTTGGLFGNAALGGVRLGAASTKPEGASTSAAEQGEQTVHNVIIVGAGPAGYTAAIYAELISHPCCLPALCPPVVLL